MSLQKTERDFTDNMASTRDQEIITPEITEEETQINKEGQHSNQILLHPGEIIMLTRLQDHQLHHKHRPIQPIKLQPTPP